MQHELKMTKKTLGKFLDREAQLKEKIKEVTDYLNEMRKIDQAVEKEECEALETANWIRSFCKSDENKESYNEKNMRYQTFIGEFLVIRSFEDMLRSGKTKLKYSDRMASGMKSEIPEELSDSFYERIEEVVKFIEESAIDFIGRIIHLDQQEKRKQ